MCDCSKVHLFEVEFKLDGMTVYLLIKIADLD